jgi:thiol-disulfide isomerase/thioredoxin
MKQVLTTLACLLWLLAASAKGDYVITGKVTGDLKGRNRIYITDYSMMDSADVKDGRYTIHYSFDKPVTLYVYTQYHSEAGIFAFTPLVVDKPGTVEVDFDVKEYFGVVANNATAVEYSHFTAQYNPLSRGYKEDDPLAQSRIATAQADLLRKLVKEGPDRFSTAYIIDEYTSRMGAALQEELYNALGKTGKATEPGLHMKARLEGLKNAAIGNVIPDFTLNDAQGKAFNIHSLRGKYVIIDFWASWCAPCRASFPHLKSVYEQYKSKGLEIVSISTDKNKGFWRTAMQEENLPWPQLLDDKNISQRGFAVTGIPSMFLIGPDGKVLEKQLGSGPDGGPVDRKLEALFGDSKPAVSQYIDYDELQQQIEPKVQGLAARHQFTTLSRLNEEFKAIRNMDKIPEVVTLPAAATRVMTGREIFNTGKEGVMMLGKLYNCGSCDQLHSGTLATAVVLTADGICATNYHVLKQVLGVDYLSKYSDSLLYVASSEGEVYGIEKILAFNKDGDVAIFKVNTGGRKMSPVALGAPAQVGDPVHAITHPSGYPYYYSTGVVTRNVKISGEGAAGIRMEISADFARGSSGGPILDNQGNLIGMVASTIPIYYVQETEKAFQMVIKCTIPVQTIRGLLL